ncbi:MAG: hypothetical protein ABI134_18970, partial [Byssovorax sp.]
MRGPGFALAAALAALTATTPARAEDDGVYGRLDGDLELRAEAGAGFASGGPSLAAGVSALYLGTAGFYVHYTDALGTRGADVTRSIAAGLHLEPLFLARYASDLEHGPARLDLLIDSFGVEIGSFWSAPRGYGLAAEPGLELAATLAVPLLARANGPFIALRGALRLRQDDAAASIDRAGLFSLTLSFRTMVPVHFVDAG